MNATPGKTASVGQATQLLQPGEDVTTGPHPLLKMPASFFGIVLGLAGLANVWRVAHLAWNVPTAAGGVIFALALLAWVVIAALYSLKWVLATSEARDEAGHPVQCCFIGLAAVATLLVAQGLLQYARSSAIFLTLVGAVFCGVFAVWRTGLLWRGDRDPASATPVLYLPLVAGQFVTGAVVAELGWREWGQLAFGAGVFSWLAIESVLLQRLYHAPAMAPSLRPTLGVQLAPAAVGAVCYLAVGSGHSDLVVHMLIGYALLQTLILIRLLRWIQEQAFTVAYWSFTFGATALASAIIRVSGEEHETLLTFMAPAFFVFANIIVLGILLGTFRLMLRGELLKACSARTP